MPERNGRRDGLLMDGFLAADSRIPRPGRAHQEVVAYLQRTTRLNYRRVDIERVCEFLGHMNGQGIRSCSRSWSMLGLKQHPESVLLNFRAGALATKTGLFTRGPKASKVSGDRPEAGGIVDPAQRNGALAGDQEDALTLINEMSSRNDGLPLVR